MTLARKALLWSVSLLLVGAVHVALFCWAMNWQVEPLKAQLPPPALMISLAPAPALPVAPPAPIAPPPPEPKPVEPAPAPKVVEAPKPRLELAKPKPPKPEPKPPEPKPAPKPEPKPTPEPVPAPTPAPSQPTAPVAPPNNPAPALKAPPAAVAGPSVAEVNWQSQLMAHLARYKRYPDDARRRNQEGRVTLRFSVDANGQVLSQTLVGRSGSPSLDRATQQMIRRAQPLPRPPANILRNGSVEVLAPFDYALERR